MVHSVRWSTECCGTLRVLKQCMQWYTAYTLNQCMLWYTVYTGALHTVVHWRTACCGTLVHCMLWYTAFTGALHALVCCVHWPAGAICAMCIRFLHVRRSRLDAPKSYIVRFYNKKSNYPFYVDFLILLIICIYFSLLIFDEWKNYVKKYLIVSR